MADRRPHGLDVRGTKVCDREKLYEIGAVVVSGQDLRGRERAGHGHKPKLPRALYDVDIGIGGDDILCPRAGGKLNKLNGGHCARADLHSSAIRLADGLDRGGGGCPAIRVFLVKGYFNKPETARVEGSGDLQAFFRRDAAHNRDQLFFFYGLNYIFSH